MFYMIKSYEWLSKKIQTKASGYSSVGTVFAWHAQGTQFDPQHFIKPGMAGYTYNLRKQGGSRRIKHSKSSLATQ